MGAHLSSLCAAGPAAGEPQLRKAGSVVKLVLPAQGCTLEVCEPVKVAELMLDFPNHFVAELGGDSHALPFSPPFSTRISPLPADHTAQLGRLYLLLPMHRLKSRLSGEELRLIAALAATPCSAAHSPALAQLHMPSSLPKAGLMSSKVTPLSVHHYSEPATCSDTAPSDTIAGGGAAKGGISGSIAKSYSVPILELLEKLCPIEESNGLEAGEQLHVLRSKSWTPKLETILESS